MSRVAKVALSAGVAAGAVAVARRRSQSADTAVPFFDTGGPVSSVDLAMGPGFDATIELPIRYHRSDCFLAVFSADAEAATNLLPSDRLHPVRISGGRVAVGVIAYNYLETTVGSYGEIGVVVLCTLDRPGPPVLPALAEGRWSSFGAFVVHLPVTTRVARQAGRTVWGYPKFVSDMAFDLTPERTSVALSEGGQEILSLDVARRGRLVSDRTPLVTFTERHGELVRTSIALRTAYRIDLGRPRAGIELGSHPVADELRILDLGPTPLVTKSYIDHAAILPVGEVIGSATRTYEGYQGTEAETGRHTITYGPDFERVVTEASSPAEPATAREPGTQVDHGAR